MDPVKPIDIIYLSQNNTYKSRFKDLCKGMKKKYCIYDADKKNFS